MTRESGICVSWKGGFGFIRPATGGRDVFCSFRAIETEEKYRVLDEGAVVTFERGTDPMGRPCAVAVRLEAEYGVQVDG